MVKSTFEIKSGKMGEVLYIDVVNNKIKVEWFFAWNIVSFFF